MKLILIRHAQSIRNAVFKGNHFYLEGQDKLGIPNHFLPLTPKGERQAEEVANFLYSKIGREHTRPVHILHSGFVRTKQTAEIILRQLEQRFLEEGLSTSFSLEQNHLLRERDAGHAFEMNENEAHTQFPFLKDYWKFEGNWFAVPPGGESFIQVMDRVALFLNTLTMNEKYRGETIYAVSHGGTMRAFQLVIEKIPFEKADELVIHPKNCEIANYEWKKGVWNKV